MSLFLFLFFSFLSSPLGKRLVHIREYYRDKNGDMKPGKTGIALTEDQWRLLGEICPLIDDEL